MTSQVIYLRVMVGLKSISMDHGLIAYATTIIPPTNIDSPSCHLPVSFHTEYMSTPRFILPLIMVYLSSSAQSTLLSYLPFPKLLFSRFLNSLILPFPGLNRSLSPTFFQFSHLFCIKLFYHTFRTKNLLLQFSANYFDFIWK